MKEDQVAAGNSQQASSLNQGEFLNKDLIDQFCAMVKDESLGETLREKLHQTVDQLQQELHRWFNDFNHGTDIISINTSQFTWAPAKMKD